MLEHTRVLYFRWGHGDDEESLLLSSADWMNRNMTRRIEIAWPVLDPVLRQRVIDECLRLTCWMSVMPGVRSVMGVTSEWANTGSVHSVH